MFIWFRVWFRGFRRQFCMWFRVIIKCSEIRDFIDFDRYFSSVINDFKRTFDDVLFFFFLLFCFLFRHKINKTRWLRLHTFFFVCIFHPPSNQQSFLFSHFKKSVYTSAKVDKYTSDSVIVKTQILSMLPIHNNKSIKYYL